MIITDDTALLSAETALDLLKEMELLRVENRRMGSTPFDINLIMAKLWSAMECHQHRMSITAWVKLRDEFHNFWSAVRKGEHLGACADFHFRLAQANVARVAGFPDRQSWSSYLVDHMGVTASW